MVRYIVLHEHEFGVNHYEFKSNDPDLEEELYCDEGFYLEDEASQWDEVDEKTQEIINRLGIDYDINSMDESLHIRKAESKIPLILFK